MWDKESQALNSFVPSIFFVGFSLVKFNLGVNAVIVVPFFLMVSFNSIEFAIFPPFFFIYFFREFSS
jgi:hypothetical protein